MSKCEICGNKKGIKEYQVRERQLNKGESFKYIYCPKCSTLQLAEEISDMAGYYGKNYYSFHFKSKRYSIPGIIVKPVLKLSSLGIWGKDIPRTLGRCANLSFSLYGTRTKFNDRILDVGAGNGFLASFLAKNGYRHITAIDLFCDKSPFHNIRFLNCEICDLGDDESYDLIMFNSSFEHMKNPHEVFEKARTLLSDRGTLLIKVPVISAMAWKKYGIFWYQIDAPRHYFLYSPKSMNYLCKMHGLKIYKVMHYSGEKQEFISKCYKETQMSFSDALDAYSDLNFYEKIRWRRTARNLDRKGNGDTAWFYIRPN